MTRFNNQGFGKQRMGGGSGRCLRDASCMSMGRGAGQQREGGQSNGFGRRNQLGQSGSGESQGRFEKCLNISGQGRNSEQSPANWLSSAIDNLQQQINDLKNQLMK